MQGGFTPAYVASRNGDTETMALLLANKADINAASKVHQFKKIEIFITDLQGTSRFYYCICHVIKDLCT
jgi:ankyrin repeat protein